MLYLAMSAKQRGTNYFWLSNNFHEHVKMNLFVGITSIQVTDFEKYEQLRQSCANQVAVSVSDSIFTSNTSVLNDYK